MADWYCIGVFWVTLVITSLFTPFYCIPVGAMLCILAVSLSYRVGRHKIPPTRHSIRYAWDPKQTSVSTSYSAPRSPGGTVRAQPSNFGLPRWLTTAPKGFTAWLLGPPEEPEWNGKDYPFGTQRLDALLSYYNKQLLGEGGASCSAMPRTTPAKEDHGGFQTTTAADKPTGIQDGRCQTPTPKAVGLHVDLKNEPLVPAVGLKTPTFQTAGLGGLLPSGSPKSPSKGLFLWTRTPESLPCVSVVQSPFGELALSVNDPGSYCPNFAVFADDAGDQDIQQLLEHGLELLDVVQRSTGIMSSTVEKLKFAFNWEDPLMTIASYAILVLGALGLTVVFFVASCLPSWVARLPVLFPWVLFVSVTDPWIQTHFWLAVLGIDVPFLYCALLSRVTLQKARVHCRTSNLSTGQVAEETTVSIAKGGDRVACEEPGNHATANSLPVIAKTSILSPQRKDGEKAQFLAGAAPQLKLKIEGPSGTTSLSCVTKQQDSIGTHRDEVTQKSGQRPYAADLGIQDSAIPELEKPAAPNRFFSIRFDGLFGGGQRGSVGPSTSGRESGAPGGAAIATGSASAETNRWDMLRTRFAQLITPGQLQPASVPASSGLTRSTSGTPSQRSDTGRSLACGVAGEYVGPPQRAVSVLNVTTRVVTAAGDVRTFSYKRFLYTAWRWSAKSVVGLHSAVTRVNARFCLWNRLYPVCLQIGYYVIIVLLHVLDVVVRLLRHWWLRLPDRREIEHRQIAVSQFVTSLERLQSLEAGSVTSTAYGRRSASVTRAQLFPKSSGGASDYRIHEDQHRKSAGGNILPVFQGTERTHSCILQQENEAITSCSLLSPDRLSLVQQRGELEADRYPVESHIDIFHKDDSGDYTSLFGKSAVDRGCQPEPSPAAPLRFSALNPSGLSQLRERFRRRTVPLKDECPSPKFSVIPGETSCTGNQFLDTTTTAATSEPACSREDSNVEAAVLMKDEAANVGSQQVIYPRSKGHDGPDGRFTSNARKESEKAKGSRDLVISSWTAKEGPVSEYPATPSYSTASQLAVESQEDIPDSLRGSYSNSRVPCEAPEEQKAHKMKVSTLAQETEDGATGGTFSESAEDGCSLRSGLDAAAVSVSSLQKNTEKGTIATTNAAVTDNNNNNNNNNNNSNLYGFPLGAIAAELFAVRAQTSASPCGVTPISSNTVVCSTVQPEKLHPVKEFFHLLAQRFEKKTSASVCRTAAKEEVYPSDR